MACVILWCPVHHQYSQSSVYTNLNIIAQGGEREYCGSCVGIFINSIVAISACTTPGNHTKARGTA